MLVFSKIIASEFKWAEIIEHLASKNMQLLEFEFARIINNKNQTMFDCSLMNISAHYHPFQNCHNFQKQYSQFPSFIESARISRMNSVNYR